MNYKCGECHQTSTEKEWNDTTIKHCEGNGWDIEIEFIQDARENADYFCPKCLQWVDGEEIKID